MRRESRPREQKRAPRNYQVLGDGGHTEERIKTSGHVSRRESGRRLEWRFVKSVRGLIKGTSKSGTLEEGLPEGPDTSRRESDLEKQWVS